MKILSTKFDQNSEHYSRDRHEFLAILFPRLSRTAIVGAWNWFSNSKLCKPNENTRYTLATQLNCLILIFSDTRDYCDLCVYVFISFSLIMNEAVMVLFTAKNLFAGKIQYG